MKKIWFILFVLLMFTAAACSHPPEVINYDISGMLDSGIEDIERNYVDKDGYIPQESQGVAIRDVLAFAESQMKSGNVTYYEEGINTVYMELADGTGYVYIPNIEGWDAGGDELKITTMQPFYSDYIEERGDKYIGYMQMVDDAGQRVDEFSDYHTFDSGGGADDNFDNEEVTLDALKNFSQYSIIIWHGHGGYSERHGSNLLTGIKSTPKFILEHWDDYQAKRLLLSFSGRVVVTSKFFDYYLDDNALEGSLVYLGTCSSGVDSRLSDVLINKGAEVVYANSGVIYTVYNINMIYAVFSELCMLDAQGYTTAAEALASAKEWEGAYNNVGGEHRNDVYVKLFGDENYTLAVEADGEGTLPDGDYIVSIGGWQGDGDDFYDLNFVFSNIEEVSNGYIVECEFFEYAMLTYEEYNRIISGEVIDTAVGKADRWEEDYGEYYFTDYGYAVYEIPTPGNPSQICMDGQEEYCSTGIKKKLFISSNCPVFFIDWDWDVRESPEDSIKPFKDYIISGSGEQDGWYWAKYLHADIVNGEIIELREVFEP